MATHEPSIFGRLIPDSSGNVMPVPFVDVATNDVWEYQPLIFADSATRDGAGGSFIVPPNYSSATANKTNLLIRWTALVTTGDVEWDLDYRAVAVGEGLDQAGTQEAVNQNDTAPGTANIQLEAVLLLTEGNFVAGDLVQFTLFRDGTDSGDTMSAAAVIHDVIFQYDDA